MDSLDTIMKIKQRIHIAPVGFEIDRIVLPAVDYKADKVYLLVHDKKKEDKAGPYIDSVIKELKKHKIESEKVLVDWRDVESITKTARQLLLRLHNNEVFVNIASGSKNHAIALDRAIMTLDDQEHITQFYAESEAYEGFEPGKQQLSIGVKEVKEIPKRQMVLPQDKQFKALQILYEMSEKRRCTFPCKKHTDDNDHKWGYMTKTQLKNECVKRGVLVQHSSVLSSLNKLIIEKLITNWNYIKIKKDSTRYLVSLSTDGMAFMYEMTP